MNVSEAPNQLKSSPHSDDDEPESPIQSPQDDSPDDLQHSQDAQPQTDKPTAPLQKRRRVTRACDECRRKKIKCDGKQPCTHCTVYSYECTFDQPSNRRRNAAPQYIEALESRLKRAESLLRLVMPNVDPNDPHLEAGLQQGVFPALARGQQDRRPRSGGRSQLPGTPSTLQNGSARDGSEPPDRGAAGTESQLDTQLESMVQSTGQLDLDEQGHWDYHGHSSGFSFLQRMREQFGDIILTPASGILPLPKSRPMSQVFDSPRSHTDSPLMDHGLPGMDLPSKEFARQLCDHAINDATALLRVVHQPSFFRSFDRIYSKRPEDYGNAENKFLPLLYAVLALGSLFARDVNHDTRQLGYENAIDEGFKYFRASRQLLDIADCRDLTSLQAIVFMILFLQSSAKLSTCYSYIGVALRSALRMGLHRSFNANFNPIEAESRKRVFWVIRKMDTYVGCLLGLPHSLNDEDIDQEFPTEIDDEYITETETWPMPEGEISVNAASNAHTMLIRILAKIVRHIYPIKSHKTGASMQTYSVNYTKIRDIEKDLQDWMDKLPMGLRPGGEARPMIVRVRHLLRMSYAHTQMMLYRPFLHYVQKQKCKSVRTDKRSYACAAACVSVSRNIIHILEEMKRRSLLIGAYWFTIYTAFFAILSLVYFYLENPDDPTSQDALRDAREGKETLAQLAKRSMAADRCTIALSNVFKQLPERATLTRRGTTSEKKRRQEASPHPQAPKASGESPDRKAPTLDTNTARYNRSNTHSDSLQNEMMAKRASFPFQNGLSNDPYAHSSYLSGFQTPQDHLFDQPTNNLNMSPAGLTTASTPTSSLQHAFDDANTPRNRQSFPITPPNGQSYGSVAAAMAGSGPDQPMAFDPPLTDLSAMMFPSADPFAYPNQPMTTFENSGLGIFGDGNNGNNGNASMPNSATPATPTRHIRHTSGHEPSTLYTNFPTRSSSSRPGSAFGPSAMSTSPDAGNLDVQLFGPMPMYMMGGSSAGNNANGVGFGPALGNPSGAFDGTTTQPTADGYGDTSNTDLQGDVDIQGAMDAQTAQSTGGGGLLDGCDGTEGNGFSGGSASQQQQQQQQQLCQSGGQGNMLGFDELFGGEEWAGMFDPAMGSGQQGGGAFGGGYGMR